ncbi:cholinephosphotransferase 1 isoform X3 [Stomoxys calcitrans]|uniref:cholinephosphotransferase 1 isoform X3 n=1 Tax=Stomoxys calcitrans TaxID=35570 RepID=UPI0027E2998A|nr:cholinephosphotransferase 1 isoform X3 [Stomoxys calcitrans]
MAYKERILTPQQLKKLSEHKYNCTNSSLLDPWLQPWWNWLVSKTPLWLAPNLITIVGLVVNIITTLILVAHAPEGTAPPPRWTCLLCALGLFIYQSLDSIDGKQARRTNTSSPLGELFDHGCDSISTVFVALSACISCQLGHYPNWLFFQCFCAIGLFYCAHWQTYVSGTLRFGKIDVTEAQFTIMGIHMISFFFGPEIWMTKIFGNLELWSTLCLMTLVCGLWSLRYIFSVILAGGVGKNGSTVALPIVGFNQNYIILIGITICYFINFTNFSKIFLHGGSGKNGSSVAGTSVLSPSIPLTLVVLPAFIIAQKSPENIFTEHSSLYIVAFGMVAAKVTNKLVIAHMTKAEMEYLDWSLLGPALLFLNQYFNCVVPEIWLLWFSLIWGTQDLVRYCSQVCLEICAHLNIQLFTIPYPPKGVKAQASNSSKPKNVQTVNQGTNPPVKHKKKSTNNSSGNSGNNHVWDNKDDLDGL